MDRQTTITTPPTYRQLQPQLGPLPTYPLATFSQIYFSIPITRAYIPKEKDFPAM